MALIFNADRVKESTSTTGTGTFSLGGAATGGFQTFVAGVGTGNRCLYCAFNAADNEWEVGLGTVTDASPDTLSRDEVWRSSNSNAKVNFTASPTVFVTDPALIDPRPAHNYLYNGSGRIAQRGTQLGARPTASVSMMSPALTSVSSLTGLRPGMLCYNATYVTGGQTINTIDSATQVTMSANGTGASPGAVAIEIGLTDGMYCADRWYVLAQTKNMRYDRSTGDSDDYAIKLTQNHATAQRFGLAQVLEQKDTKPLRSKTVRAQCRVKVSTGTPTIRIAILAWTGTADSPTKDVVLDWTSSTFTAGNFFLASNLTVVATGSLTASTSWQDLSVIGTLGSNPNNAYVFVWTDATAAQDVTLEVTEAGLYATPVPQNWNPRPVVAERLLCSRYYTKTFDDDVAPVAASADYSGSLHTVASGTAAGTALICWFYPTQMRASPTLLTFNPIAYASSWYRAASGVSYAATTIYPGVKGVTVYNNDVVVDTGNYNIHGTADAEL